MSDPKRYKKNKPEHLASLNVRACSFYIALLLFSSGTTVFPTLFADLRIKLRPLMAFRRLATLLANFSVELWPSFLFDSLATLLANLGVKFSTILLTYSLATMLCLLRSRCWSTFVVCHRKSRLSKTRTSTFTQLTMR